MKKCLLFTMIVMLCCAGMTWAKSVQALYRMDESDPSDPNLIDSSAYGNTATLLGGNRVADGPYGSGYALDFLNTANHEFLIPDSAQIQPGADDFTWVLWYKPHDEGRTGICADADQDWWLSLEFCYSDGIAATNNVSLWAGSGAGWNIFQNDRSGDQNAGTGIQPLIFEDWNQIVVTKEGDVFKTYINGFLDLNKDITGWLPSGTGIANFPGDKVIGRWWTRPAFKGIDAVIDEFAVLDWAVSQEEAVWLLTNPVPLDPNVDMPDPSTLPGLPAHPILSEPNSNVLRCYFSMDEGSGGAVHDTSYAGSPVYGAMNMGGYNAPNNGFSSDTPRGWPGYAWESNDTNGRDVLTFVHSDEAWDWADRDFSLQLWFKPKTAGQQSIFSATRDLWFGMMYDFHVTRNVCLWAASEGGAGWDMIQCDNPAADNSGVGQKSLKLGEWNHIVVARNGQNWKTYINGRLDLDITPPNGALAIKNMYRAKRIGEWGNYALGMNAYVDELAVWNHALTDNEVWYYYTNKIDPDNLPDPGTLPEPPGELEPYCVDYLKTDLNKDCYVDLADFALLAGQWLLCNDENNEACSE